MRADRWEALSSSLREQFGGLPMLERIDEDGPLAFLAGAAGIDDTPEQLAADRPLYARLDIVGDAAVQRAAQFGLPVPGLQPPPAGFHLRLLVPTDEPEALASRLTDFKSESDAPGILQVHAGEAFVRVDTLLTPGGPLPKSRRSEIRADLAKPATDAPTHRPTPALRRFLNADDALALYANMADLRELTVANMGLEVSRALDGVSPQNRLRMLSKAFSLKIGFAMLAPESAQSIEDVTVTFGSDAESGLVAHFDATRTALGQRIQAQTAGPADLPAWSPKTPEGGSPIVDTTFALDWKGLEEHAPGGAKWVEGDGAPFDNAMRVGRLQRSIGLSAYLATLYAPEHYARLMGRALAYDGGVPFPSAAALRITFDRESKGAALRGGLLARFDTDADEAEEIRGRLEKMARAAKRLAPGELEVQTRSVDAGDLELRVALETSTDALTAEDTRTAPVGLRGDFHPSAALGYATRMNLLGTGGFLAGALSEMDPVRLETASGRAERRLRLHVGTAELDELTAAEEVPAAELSDDDGCRFEMRRGFASVARRFREAWENPPESVEPLVDDYDAVAEKCRQEGALDADSADWARGRFRWFLAKVAEQRLQGRIGPVQTCLEAGDSNRPTRSRRSACDRLPDDPDELADRLEKARTYRRLAKSYYETSCELGDDISCTRLEKIGLPKVPPTERIEKAVTRGE